MNKVIVLLVAFIGSSSFAFSQLYIEQLLANEEFENAYVKILEEEKNIPKFSDEYFGLEELKSEVFFGLGLFDSIEVVSNKLVKYLINSDRSVDTLLVTPYSNLGGVYFYYGEYSKALSYFEKIDEILVFHNLENEEHYAQLHNNMGLLYSYVGEYRKSLNSLHYSETYFDSINDIASLSLVQLNIGNSNHSLYKYKEAEVYYSKAKYNMEQSEMITTLDYNNVLLNLSTLYIDLGDNEKGLIVLEKAAKLAKEVEGKESISYAKILNNYGEYYKRSGDYGKAEHYLLESIQLKKRLLGRDHPDYLLAHNNLAMLESNVGRYTYAENRMKSVIDIAENNKVDNLGGLPDYYNNLASVFAKESEWRSAEQYYHKSLKLTKELKGNESEEYLLTLQNLIVLYLAKKKYDKAAEFLEDITPNQLKHLQIKDQANFLNSSAFINKQNTNIKKAESEFLQALTLLEGQNKSQDYAIIKINLGVLQAENGRIKEAAINIEQGLESLIENIQFSFPTFTEHEKELFLWTIWHYSQYYYSFVGDNHEEFPALIGKCLDLRMTTKALALRSTESFENKITNSSNNRAKSEWKELLLLKHEIAKYYGLSKHQLKSSGYDLEKKHLEFLGLEKAFYLKFGEEFSETKTQTWKKLQIDLKPNEAALEVIRTERLDKKVIYFALLLSKTGMPQLIELNQGYDFEGRQFSYYQKATKLKLENKYSYDAYWKAINSKLQGVDKIYYSPDGIYHKINLNSLFNKESQKYLIEEIEISRRLSLGDIAFSSLTGFRKDISLFGHPKYYLDLKEAISSLEKNEEPLLRTITPEFEEWTDLPGTKEEVDDINSLLMAKDWKCNVYTEEKALENTVKKVESPSILHIATHGWFSVESDSLNHYDQDYFEAPLLKNGLVFSGGGLHLTPGDINSAYFEDGLLTANEARLLNLRNTNLVVLSACQTGLGDIRNEEGVFGLQRSFKIAGAKAIVMSLWSVDDSATKDLMVSFYTSLANDIDVEKAFLQAIMQTKEKYSHPFYWSPFVLVR